MSDEIGAQSRPHSPYWGRLQGRHTLGGRLVCVWMPVRVALASARCSGGASKAPMLQKRVLLQGVPGAIVMRATLIWLGARMLPLDVLGIPIGIVLGVLGLMPAAVVAANLLTSRTDPPRR